MRKVRGKIIAFTGAHGTGKTTAVYECAALLKKSSRTEIGLITEVARDCPLPVYGKRRSVQDFFAAQMWMFVTQMKREIEMADRFETIVSDRTVVDVAAYSLFLGYEDLAADQLALARNHIAVYDRIILIKAGCRPEYLAEDGFRGVDVKEQAEVEALLLRAYQELGIELLDHDQAVGVNNDNYAGQKATCEA